MNVLGCAPLRVPTASCRGVGSAGKGVLLRGTGDWVCAVRPCFCRAERQDVEEAAVPMAAAPWAWPLPWLEELFGHWCSGGWTLVGRSGVPCRGCAVGPLLACVGLGAPGNQALLGSGSNPSAFRIYLYVCGRPWSHMGRGTSRAAAERA